MILLTIYVIGCLITIYAAVRFDLENTGKLVLSNLLSYILFCPLWPFVLIMAIGDVIIELDILNTIIWRKRK